MEPSLLVSPNGAWQRQPQRPPVRWRSTQEVMILSQVQSPRLASVWIQQQRLNCSTEGPHTFTHAYKSRPHILVSLIKWCVWWWKLGCDERVCGVQRRIANASEHRISPLLLIRARHGRIKGLTPESARCDSTVCLCQWWKVTKYIYSSTLLKYSLSTCTLFSGFGDFILSEENVSPLNFSFK